MKKLVSVIGSLIVGMNVGAVGANATYDCVNAYYEEIGWKKVGECEFKKNNMFEIRCMLLNKVRGFEKSVGLTDFVSKAVNYSEFACNLKIAFESVVTTICYIVPDYAFREGMWPFYKYYYRMFEDEYNVKCVKSNFPDFLRYLSNYLNSKDSADYKQMIDALKKLPKALSEEISKVLSEHELNKGTKLVR